MSCLTVFSVLKYHMVIFQSLIDEEEYVEVKAHVTRLTEAIEHKNYTNIHVLYEAVMDRILSKTNPYNIADHNFKIPSIYSVDLSTLMDGQVREHLQIIPTDVIWGKKITTTYDSSLCDFWWEGHEYYRYFE